MDEVVNKLIEVKKTISTMESCTGGAVVNAITSVPGASNVLKYSAVTYSNEFKIKMGVSKDIIDTYSVYSMETARDMSLTISNYTFSDYGIGVTGKLNRPDEFNDYGKDNEVFISIYDRNNDCYYDFSLLANQKSREDNKLFIVSFISEKLNDILG